MQFGCRGNRFSVFFPYLMGFNIIFFFVEMYDELDRKRMMEWVHFNALATVIE